MRNHLLIFLALLLAPMLPAARVPGRYIVELYTEPVSEKGSLGVDSMSRRSRLRSEQQSLRQMMALRNATVTGSVETVANALFVQVPDSEAARLATLPGVKRVIPVRTYKMVMDRAVLLHKAADAWTEAGGGLAGAGIKIAIIDSGIEHTHPGFEDSSLPMPESYPRAGSEADLALTNNKVIVARSYVDLLPFRDLDTSARDHVGHGTALGMAAAGVRVAGPKATVSGIAPKAYLGNYRVFGTPGYNEYTTDEAILKAIDDAVADGMDVINLSLGSDLAPRLEDDIEVQAVERATRAGVIVIAAAGNNGPELNTLSSPATAPSAIAVGATTNDRIFGTGVDVLGLGTLLAVASSTIPDAPVAAPVIDVATLNNDGLACSPLQAESLRGVIALIHRGSCNFEDKLNFAQTAGAVGALVYAREEAPEPIEMYVGAATLPSLMISFQDGVRIKESIAAGSATSALMKFTEEAIPVTGNRLTDFTAKGPNVDLGIKPELMAAGQNIYTATQTLNPRGDMYDQSGYTLVDGTSFSTPIVAGAAAMVKAARPGLTVDQYRSLLVNTTGIVEGSTVQQSGAGFLDVQAAIRSTVAAYPVSLSYGRGSGDTTASQTLRLTNLANTTDTLSIEVVPANDSWAPAAGQTTIEVEAGGSVEIPVAWAATGLPGGTYEGYVAISAAGNGSRIRVPYWYSVTSNAAAKYKIFDLTTSGRRGGLVSDAVLIRLMEESGVAVTEPPQVTVTAGEGSVHRITSYDAEVPGLFGIDLQLGNAPGINTFRIQSGTVTLDISITGR